jgi:hypothetical protein
MLGIGIFLAGLFLLVVQGVSILGSLRSGVIISKSYGAARIERASETDRFNKLIKQRTTALTPALVLLVVGFLLTFGGLFIPAP